MKRVICLACLLLLSLSLTACGDEDTTHEPTIFTEEQK